MSMRNEHCFFNTFLLFCHKFFSKILRMLDCSGGENVYNAINDELEDAAKSVELVNEIIVLSKKNIYRIKKEPP